MSDTSSKHAERATVSRCERIRLQHVPIIAADMYEHDKLDHDIMFAKIVRIVALRSALDLR